MNKFCQSCGMPLSTANAGTESDGSVSNNYCNLCYKNGVFVEPEITFEEMKKRGINGIAHGDGNKFKKWLLKVSYPMQLKGLERWKK